MENMMSRTLLPISLVTALTAGVAFADVPRVATDIAPVHSLVARVMGDLGTPGLVIQSGASPHEYALRPSDANTLQTADLIFWIGSDLTPTLGDTITTIAPDALVIELLEDERTVMLESREGALFEKHDHGDEEHEDEDHETHEEHEDGHEDHADHEGHDHDPHAWLSVQNAATWLNVIAGQLSEVDPEHAGTYFANAAAGRAELAVLSDEVNEMLEPVRTGRFIVFHDAYQYFETDFDFTASGAISIGDASDPSPARIGEIRDRIAAQGIDCVLTEPQFNAGLVAAVLDGSEAKTSVLDPMGSDLKSGPKLYPQMIRNLAAALVECL
jgi:zinc transport system substrate-binding protein